MKKVLLFLFFFQWILVNNSSAQLQLLAPIAEDINKYKVVDTCLYKAYYEMKFYPSPDKKDTLNDIQMLEIGKHGMKCSSYLLYKNDSIATVYIDKGSDYPGGDNGNVFPVETMLNLNNRTMTLTYRTLGPTLRYTEPTEEIKWQISDKTDTIMSYICQEATCQFRGRAYTAWFTTGIPFNYGPYKFYGLPGLILKISDSNNEYSWQCYKFVKAYPKETIKDYKRELCKITTREKMAAILKRAYAGPFSFCKSFGMKFMLPNADGTASPPTHDITLPYNPIEK